ncbi:MAG: FGGY-family carbohydrate kinase [Spirochaetales bacterium]|nr:FGGY-family carbohydrate kinase [Spirochaetales bacterium]
MKKECFLGIDIGTGSSKGVITDIDGKILSQASVPHELDMPRPGWYEQDADSVWWGDFVKLCRLLLSKADLHPERIMAVGLSTIAPCVLPVDSAGKPLRPGIMYGIDTRAAAEIREIEKQIGRDEIFRISGQDLSSQSCCPKILWIKKNEPEVWAATDKILTAAGYLVYKLTGRHTVDIYDAIGYAPLFNIRDKTWDPAYANLLFDQALLPELLWSSETAGRITPEAAALTGLTAGTPVITGTADAASEAVGAGVCRSGDMMMMYGSSNFFILRTKELNPLASFWASNFTDEGSSVLTGGMSTVGSLFKWFTEAFPGRSFEQWEALSAASPAGAGGITVLPYFAGERTPLNAPEAKGAIFGLTLQSKPGDIWKALQESIGFGIRHNIEVLRDEGVEARRIMAIGGASESRSLLQTISDITGITQYIPDKTLGACYGDAFLAAVGTGYFNSSEESYKWVGVEGEITPDRHLAKYYNEQYLVFRDLYESTAHLN